MPRPSSIARASASRSAPRTGSPAAELEAPQAGEGARELALRAEVAEGLDGAHEGAARRVVAAGPRSAARSTSPSSRSATAAKKAMPIAAQ